MKTIDFFETHPIFRYEEFTEFMAEQGIDNPANARQQLQYHCKQGNLWHIRRLLYAVKPFPAVANVGVDPYLIAAKATQDAVLSHHTALELHGFAYTTFETLTYLTAQASKPFTYEDQNFRSVRFPTSLQEKNKTDYGVDTITRGGVTIRLTSLERTIVDILERPDLAGGWEEVLRSLEQVVSFDAQKLIDYTLMLDNATTVAKVGFFLEQRPEHLAVQSSITDQLLPYLPTQPHYIDRSQRKDGKLIKKWQLIVPAEILEQRWKEPHDNDH